MFDDIFRTAILRHVFIISKQLLPKHITVRSCWLNGENLLILFLVLFGLGVCLGTQPVNSNSPGVTPHVFFFIEQLIPVADLSVHVQNSNMRIKVVVFFV